MNVAQTYCTFFLDGAFFGVEVHRVQEVIRFQEMTPVPLASPVVAGLINLRGQIVPAIDLRRRLGLPDRGPDRLPMNVVVRNDGEIVSLLVDAIGDVQEVAPEIFEQAPPTLSADAASLVRGAYKLDGRLLLALETDRICDLPDASMVEAA